MEKLYCSRCGSRLPGHEPSCPRGGEAAAWERERGAVPRQPAPPLLPATSAAAPPPNQPAKERVDPAVNERELQLIRERLLEERARMRNVSPTEPARKRRLVRAGTAAVAAGAALALLFWSPWSSTSDPFAGNATQTTTDVPEVAGVRDVTIPDETPVPASDATPAPFDELVSGDGEDRRGTPDRSADRSETQRPREGTGSVGERTVAEDSRVGSTAAARAEIRSTIGGYARAVESRDVRQLRRMYPRLTPEEERKWREFFASVRDLDADLDVVALDVLDVASATAVVRVTGTYSYRNQIRGRDERSPVDFEATLRRASGGWFVSSIH